MFRTQVHYDLVINEIMQHYSSHPSIIKIRKKLGNPQNIGKFLNDSVTSPEILKLLKNIDDKKAAGTDKIPPKLEEL